MMRTEFTMDQMNQVNGGAKMYDPGFLYQMRFTFNDEDVVVLAQYGKYVEAGKTYTRGELNDLGFGGMDGLGVKEALERMGIVVLS